MSSFNVRRKIRRFAIMLLVPVVLLFMFVGWCSEQGYAVFHKLVVLLRLSKLEDALRKIPIWISLPVFGILLFTWVPAKLYLLKLFLAKKYFQDFFLGLVFKVFWFGSVNYLLRLYKDQFLELRMVAFLYDKYTGAKTYVLELPWVNSAIATKRLLFTLLRLRYRTFKERHAGGKISRFMRFIRSRLSRG